MILEHTKFTHRLACALQGGLVTCLTPDGSVLPVDAKELKVAHAVRSCSAILPPPHSACA